MAIGKTAGGLILVLAAWAPAAQFPVRHEHLRKDCAGVLTVDEAGVSFAGPQHHEWKWAFSDIQELQLSPRGVHILTYEDSKLRLGRDRRYRFTGIIPTDEVYALLKARMDQRLIAEIAQATDLAGDGWSVPVKQLSRIVGSDGALTFGTEAVVYATPAGGQSRTWRYSDIEGISSSGPFELTLTSREKAFHFQLKQAITEARYNFTWLQIERKNGRIQ